jgi:hypothetical protein
MTSGNYRNLKINGHKSCRFSRDGHRTLLIAKQCARNLQGEGYETAIFRDRANGRYYIFTVDKREVK